VILVLILLAAFSASGAELPLGRLEPVPAAEAKELLRAVCPGPIAIEKEDDDKGAWGCETCPAYVMPFEWPLGWDLNFVHYGHFTTPTADEAVLAMGGCAPHSMYFGASVLLARSEGRWRMKWFQSGLITSRCMNVRQESGRDLLVCEAEDVAQGHEVKELFTVDLSQRPATRQTGLLSVERYMNSCGQNVAETTDKIDPIQEAEYRRIAFDPAAARLTVEVEYGWLPYTVQNMRACRAAQAKDMPLPAALTPKTNLYIIEFDFSGEKFSVTPDSKQAKRVVEAIHQTH
jgi:hypothetical protein